MPQDAQPEIEATDHDTPLRAARRHCLQCCGGSSHEVRHCAAKSCALWPYRLGKRPSAADKAATVGQQIYPIERTQTGATALRAIRRRCLDCAGNRDPDVRACAFNDCALHAFRLGKNPFLAPRSVEWQKAAAERLASLKTASLSKSLGQSPLSGSAQVLEGVLPPG